MSSWRAMAARGGDSDGQAMNVASPLPVILSRADGEEPVLSPSKEPRRHFVHLRIAKEHSIAGARSLSVLWRIG
jgi:hypothetical protein